MPNAWMTHVKKTRSLMGGNPSLKQVLKQAKKTYKKSGGGVASNASDFASAGDSAQEQMGGLQEGNVNKKGNESASHQNNGESADGKAQSGGRRRRRRRRSRSRRKSRKSKRKGKKSRKSRRKNKKSRKKSRRRRRR